MENEVKKKVVDDDVHTPIYNHAYNILGTLDGG